MRRPLASLILVAGLFVGCGGQASTPPQSGAPTSAPASTPLAAATPTPDPVLTGAVADALATIDEIDRLYRAGPSAATSIDAAFAVIGEVATSGRTSLAREPARITTLLPFHVYDLSLQLFEANAIIKDGSQLTKDHDWLLSANVRGKIAALAP